MTEKIILAVILYCAVHYLFFKAGERAQAFRAGKRKAGCTTCGCGDKSAKRELKIGSD